MAPDRASCGVLRPLLSLRTGSGRRTPHSSGTSSIAFRTLIQGIRLKFPSVKDVSTSTLQKWMDGGVTSNLTDTAAARTEGQLNKLIIIDARPDLEYKISHIAQSINVNFETEDMEAVKKLMLQEANSESPEQVAARVVMYCSVGYRSSILTDKLQKATKPDPAYKSWQFFSLEGSLFKWANENRPMVDQQGQPTNYLHPYSDTLGRFVDKKRWKYPPQD